MSSVTRESVLFTVLRNPEGWATFEEFLPGFVTSANLHTLHGLPLGIVLDTEPALMEDPARKLMMLERLLAIDTDSSERSDVPASLPVPSADYEDASVERSSATVVSQQEVAVWERFEITLDGPSHGNPFIDVDLAATITGPGIEVTVPGFYDGDGTFRVRFMPPTEGTFTFVTRSNALSLDGIAGTFAATAGTAHGPVRVANQFHFEYADGTRYLPIGTTSYVWNHQGDELEEATVRALESSPFNKMRMCVFPKSYLFNENEPLRYPFDGSLASGWDFTRFNPDYFRHLEERIDELAALGIEADLILFHAYDRWGFSTMDPASDDRYMRYIVARLAAFSNVWWSLANEYDLLFDKSESDWERFASIVVDGDPSGHLLSIHNCRDFYDYSRPWVTHASVQRQDVYKTAELTDQWRASWGKPVVIDECAYEGNIDQGWGNITGEEMTRRFWEGAVRGGYVGHGETYVDDNDVLWWAKGGTLKGTSPDRIGFLRTIMEEGPADGLNPIQLDWDAPRAGIEGEYYLYYFGFNQPSYRRFVLAPGTAYTAEVIDTWDMTVTPVDGTFEGRFRLELPGKPYIAVRLRALA